MEPYFERIVTQNHLQHPRVASLMMSNDLYFYENTIENDYEEVIYNVELGSKTLIHFTFNKLFDICYFYFQGIEEKTREMRRKIRVILKEYVYTRDEILALAISPSYPKEVSGIALSTSSEFD